MRHSRLLLTGPLLLFVACGVSRKQSLPATGPIQAAEIKVYGWTASDLEQSIQVTLAPAIPLGTVLDMSVFGGFTPGTTQDDALHASGPPSRTRADEWGEVWDIYELSKSRVEIGCQYYTSGGGNPSSCSWTLYAVPTASPSALLLEPQLQAYLQKAGTAEAGINTRLFEIATSDRSQLVQFFLKSRIGPGLYWSDRNKAGRREGPPKRAAQQ